MKRKVVTYKTRQSEIILHPIGGKKCSRAKTNKCVVGDVVQDIKEFSKRDHTPDGHTGTCRSCVTAASKINYAKVKQSRQEFKDMFI